MPREKPPKTDDEPEAGLDSDQAILASKFAALLESEFLRLASHGRSESLDIFREQMMQSFVVAMQETGARPAEIAELLQVGLSRLLTSDDGQWTDTKNDRRVDLIDASLQRPLSKDEAFELSQLTELMRRHCDTEDAIPMEGARKLHERLMGIERSARDPD
jgi:hypothetical protein